MKPEHSHMTPAPKAAHTHPSTAERSYPITVNFKYPETQSRLLALLSIPFFLIRIILLIPHIIVLYVIQIVGFIAAWLNFWVILFTGKPSVGLRDFVAGSLRWSTRVNAYMYGLNDQYPPFKLEN